MLVAVAAAVLLYVVVLAGVLGLLYAEGERERADELEGPEP